MFSRGLRVVLSVAAVVVLLDRISKIWAVSTLQVGHPQNFLGPILKFELTYNSGAAFSFLTSATWVFTILASLVVVAIIFKAGSIKDFGWLIAVGGILGGASGNLIDRLINDPGFAVGHVVDFLELPYWPIFNIADSAIFCSVIALVIFSFRGINADGTREPQRTTTGGIDV